VLTRPLTAADVPIVVLAAWQLGLTDDTLA
jgi:hypothetical protein